MWGLTASESVLRALYPQYTVNTRLSGVSATWNRSNRPFQPILGLKNFQKFLKNSNFRILWNFEKSCFPKSFFFRNFFGYFSDFPNIFRIFRDFSGFGSDSQRVFYPKKFRKKFFGKHDFSKFQRILKVEFFKNFWKFFQAHNWQKRTIKTVSDGWNTA